MYMATYVDCVTSADRATAKSVDFLLYRHPRQREGRWVLVDLEGKGRRIRTVAIPIWVKKGIEAWMTAAEIKDGRLLRSVSRRGKINRDTLSDL